MTQLIVIYLTGYFISCLFWNYIFVSEDDTQVAEVIIGGVLSIAWLFTLIWMVAYVLVKWRKR